MIVLSNGDIRDAIKARSLCYWQVAEAYGLTDGNFSRLLRKELNPEKKARIFAIIKELVERETV